MPPSDMDGQMQKIQSGLAPPPALLHVAGEETLDDAGDYDAAMSSVPSEIRFYGGLLSDENGKPTPIYWLFCVGPWLVLLSSSPGSP